ncbi:hypothetical protein SAMN05216502_104382 [Citrobacter amalonaticus]|nr:hypothetical protein SAMN05216502_104382 [Citrobacter amalonaticus]
MLGTMRSCELSGKRRKTFETGMLAQILLLAIGLFLTLKVIIFVS